MLYNRYAADPKPTRLRVFAVIEFYRLVSSPSLPYSILLTSVLASELTRLDCRFGELIREDVESISELMVSFLSQPVSPETFLQFELGLQKILRELGRKASGR